VTVRRDRLTHAAALVAAALAFASAVVTLFWTLGGTWLLDTVGGSIERLARDRSAGAIVLGIVVVIAKSVAGLLALHLGHSERTPSRPAATLASVGGIALALYGGVLVVAGALVLAHAINPSGAVDRHALRWHVALWDLWFVVWGVALAIAGLRARRLRVAR
jgi:hypothetical protein